MKYRLAALAAVLLMGGCGVLDSAVAGGAASPTPPAKVPSPTASAAPPADTGLGPVKDSGDLPDPCTLLTEAQVVDLTGREITRIDEDDAGGDAVTRFCQWQQSGGQLAVFLTRTTPADFEVTVADAQPVTEIGEDAFWHSGHLYVLYGTVQIDVYSRGASDDRNLADAKEVARTLIPGL